MIGFKSERVCVRKECASGLFFLPLFVHLCLTLPASSLQERVGAAEHAAAVTGSRTAAEFLNNVVMPMLAMEGDKLPVRSVC